MGFSWGVPNTYCTPVYPAYISGCMDQSRSVQFSHYDVGPSFPGSTNPPEVQHFLHGRQLAQPHSSGPPCKAKQSGHALWVGNLPSKTNIAALKDHFAAGAKDDILSVSVIPMSNCCFVNYRSEESCTAALHRFQRSLFCGHALVCRVRNGIANHSLAKPVVGTGPLPQAEGTSKTSDAGGHVTEATVKLEPLIVGASFTSPKAEDAKKTTVREKFFIMKSLSTKDLEQSVRTGTWSTQQHNEVVLNRAYHEADNVFLIFSANRSGEFFGYARIASIVSQREAMTLVPSTFPRTTLSPATQTAPKGRFVDDPMRGTSFWEVDSSDEDVDSYSDQARDRARYTRGCEISFIIQWLSTTKLPYYQTRGLRNLWKYVLVRGGFHHHFSKFDVHSWPDMY